MSSLVGARFGRTILVLLPVSTSDHSWPIEYSLPRGSDEVQAVCIPPRQQLGGQDRRLDLAVQGVQDGAVQPSLDGERYPEVQNSIASPNSLFGSMGLNGMTVLIATRQTHPSLMITETHPKVLCWHLLGEKYDYVGRRAAMDEALTDLLSVTVDSANEHEWDAALPWNAPGIRLCRE